MSTRMKFGHCTVFSLGTDGMRVGLHLGNVEHSLDVERAREIHADLGKAIEKAWPTMIPWQRVTPQWPGDEDRWCADIGEYSLFASSRGHWYVMFGRGIQSSGKELNLDDAKTKAEIAYEKLRGEP